MNRAFMETSDFQMTSKFNQKVKPVEPVVQPVVKTPLVIRTKFPESWLWQHINKFVKLNT